LLVCRQTKIALLGFLVGLGLSGTVSIGRSEQLTNSFYDAPATTELREAFEDYALENEQYADDLAGWITMLAPPRGGVGGSPSRLAIPKVFGRSNGPTVSDRRLVEQFKPQLRRVAELAVSEALASTTAGHPEHAYAWWHRVLALDPSNADARRVLTTQLAALGEKKIVRNNVGAIRDLRWRANSYTRIETPNFLIVSQAPVRRAGDLADLCETTLCVWRQVFFDYWKTPLNVQQLNAMKSVQWTPKERIRVVLFRDKSDYVAALERLEKNVALSTGYYSPALKTAFFYWESDDAIATMRHELTHSFFHQLGFKPAITNLDQQAGIWALEGVAMWMESIGELSGPLHDQVVIGGWDSRRLQAARYRRLHDQFWIPWPDISSTTAERWRAIEDLPMWYSQSAGITHFLMDSTPENRRAFLDYLELIYAGSEPMLPLASSEVDLRLQYDQFLRGDVETFSTRLQPAVRRDVVLSRTKVLSETLLQWPSTAKKLSWLDLSFTGVDDSLFADATQWSAVRLNLESTKITSASMPAIASFEELSDLDLSNCQIDSMSLQSLASHETLRTLWLTGTQVDERCVSVLQSLPKLEFVELTGTQVDDDDLTELRRSNRRLTISMQ
jgi:hypothetical protein